MVDLNDEPLVCEKLLEWDVITLIDVAVSVSCVSVSVVSLYALVASDRVVVLFLVVDENLLVETQFMDFDTRIAKIKLNSVKFILFFFVGTENILVSKL